MTKLEIIEETVEYYSEDVSRRSTIENGSICRYINHKGQNCAFSRILTEEGKRVANEYEGDVAISLLGKDVIKEKHFKDGYYHKPDLFYSDLQNLHDLSNYWDEDGLTKNGKLYVKELKEIYA